MHGLIETNTENNINYNTNSSSQTSGVSGKGSLFIRADSNSMNQDYLDRELTGAQQLKAVFGLVIYVVIFIILIPILLFKLGFIEFLKLYFVNTDMIATVISFDKGPFKDIFKYLYTDTGPLIGFISQSIINWSVLIGLFFMMLTDGRNKKVTEGLSKIAFILMITYLLPGRFIVKGMAHFYQYLVSVLHYQDTTGSLFTMLFGIVIILVFIMIELLSVNYFSPYLKNILDSKFNMLRSMS